MKANTDFYNELALLVESNLPLPDCLRKLSESLPGRGARRIANDLQDRLSKGDKLSDAMAAYPAQFEALHVRLISVGESTDSLPEILYAIAAECRVEQFLVGKAREIMTYPLFVLHMALALFVAISVLFMPVFHSVYAEIGLDAAPAFTQLSLRVSSFARRFWPFIAGMQGVCLLGTFWLYSGTVRAHRAMMRLLDRLPGTVGIARELDSARICGLCKLFLERRLPIPEALRASAAVVQLPDVRSALEDAAARTEQGEDLVEVLKAKKVVDPLITHVLKSKPEGHLAESLGDLQRKYEENVAFKTRDAAAAWTMIGITLMAIAALLMTAMVFVPVVKVHEPLQHLY